MVLLAGVISRAEAIPYQRVRHESAPPLTPREEARSILECLYRGQPDSAFSLAEAFEAKHPGDPLPLLITARVMRETLSDQDDEKKLIEKDAEPILVRLKQTISICDDRLDGDDPDASYYFYRGWAWMFKAQLDALGANYWSAARAAKKGKTDLDRFLSLHPGDPDASGLLGTFLYFADTLPAVIKLIKTLFLIPGGDKERGLELLLCASNREGILSIDHEVLLSAIFLIFEGRFEDGIRSFSSLRSRYPACLRLVEPIGVIAPLMPREIRTLQAAQLDAVTRYLDRNPGATGQTAIHRVTYHRAYSAMLCDPPQTSIEAFETLIAGAHARPDWLLPLSMINLGMLYANTAHPEKAAAMFEAIIANKRMKRFHDVAGEMLESLDEGEGKLTGIFPQLVTALYDQRFDEARGLLETFEGTAGGTIYYDFYRGDLELFTGNTRDAERWYRSALDRTVPAYAQIYQLLAATRLAELYGFQRDFDTAQELLGEALHYYHKEFLIDMLIGGRKRFYRGRSECDSTSVLRTPLPDTGPLPFGALPQP